MTITKPGKVKNISKKIIGNQSFRLLPGETMAVEGNEKWVQHYIKNGKLERVSEPVSDQETEPVGDTDAGNGSGQPEMKGTDIDSEGTTGEKEKRAGRKNGKATDDAKEV